MRSLGSLVADALAVLVFVAIGLLQHGTALTSQSLLLVAWPFVLGMLLGHLAIRSWRAPLAVWPTGVMIWAITVAAGMAVRTLFGAGTETSFVIVTAIVTGVLLLGWRAIASFVTRHERREIVAGPRRDASTAHTDGSAGSVEPEGSSESARSHSA